MFELIVESAIALGTGVAAIYATLSMIYWTYRYAKGDDYPNPKITDLDICRKDIIKLIDPFYYKHPMAIFITALAFFVGVIGGLAIVWPVIIPAGIIYYSVKKIREKNLHKKKMWETLKGS